MNMNHRKLIGGTVTINITVLCPDHCFLNCPPSCITPPPRVTATAVHRSQNHHEALIISVFIVGLACSLYCLFTLYKHCQTHRRPIQEQDQEHQEDQEEEEARDHDRFLDEELEPVLDHPIWYIRTVGLRPSVVGSITVCKYKRGEGLVEGTDCAVCLSEFEDDETLRLLPKCNHAFHVPCIDTWLGSHTSCPLCRAPIVSNPGGTLSPILGQSFQRSVVVEENRDAIPEGSGELAEEGDDGDLGSKGVESSRHGRRISGSEEKHAVQSMQRSVSMDSLAPSRLDGGIAKGEQGEMSKPNTAIIQKRADIRRGLMKSVGASSFRKSSQKGPVLMKRSLSCSGKALFSSHNYNTNSVSLDDINKS